jgi:hypothetical protein
MFPKTAFAEQPAQKFAAYPKRSQRNAAVKSDKSSPKKKQWQDRAIASGTPIAAAPNATTDAAATPTVRPVAPRTSLPRMPAFLSSKMLCVKCPLSHLIIIMQRRRLAEVVAHLSLRC